VRLTAGRSADRPTSAISPDLMADTTFAITHSTAPNAVSSSSFQASASSS